MPIITSVVMDLPVWSLKASCVCQADASNLKGEVDRILQKLTVSADAAEQSVASLAFLDLGKSRMEEACTTLKVSSHTSCTQQDDTRHTGMYALIIGLWVR